MTHVDVVYHAGQIQSIKVEGHAGQDEYGKDLACAGISTAVVGIYNMLEAKGFMKDAILPMLRVVTLISRYSIIVKIIRLF